MAVDVTRTIASLGSSIFGSGTVSQRTSPVPCQTIAFITDSLAGECRSGDSAVGLGADDVEDGDAGDGRGGRQEPVAALGVGVDEFHAEGGEVHGAAGEAAPEPAGRLAAGQ